MTADRLLGYYPFSPDVVDDVSEFVERQASFTSYQAFFDSVGLKDPFVFRTKGYKPTNIVDFRPKEHAPGEAVFYHLPMANPLDANQMFQLASVAATNPNKRILAAANPSGPGYKSGRLRLLQTPKVLKGNLGATIDPLLRYADDQKIDVSQQIGVSYGADEAMETARRANHVVLSAVAIEPVIGERSFVGLAKDFKASDAALKGYVRASKMPLFESARAEAISGKAYMLGLLRLSNLAITEALTKGGFEARTTDAIKRQEKMRTLVAWGTASELARHEQLSDFMTDLLGQHPSRVDEIVLADQKHASFNDIPLQLALIRQGLRAA